MFIILWLILSAIVISIRLVASSIDLVNMVAVSGNSLLKRKEDKSDSRKIMEGVTSLGLVTSSSFLKVSAFVLARVRDLVGFIGSLVIVLDIIILCVIVVCSGAFATLFMQIDDNGALIWNTNGIASYGVRNISSDSSDNSSSNTEVGSSAGKPSCLSDESWNSADAVGKSVVAFASNVVINPPNGKPLIYRQGNTPQGYADCSTFVCGVLEGSLKKTFSGSDAKDGFDFAKNRKSDLNGYMATSAMRSFVRKHKECIVGTTSTSLSLAKPGDILLKSGHVGIYVGKNEKGVDVMVHSSMRGANINDDINLTKGSVDVGFSKIYGDYQIIRTSKLIGQ